MLLNKTRRQRRNRFPQLKVTADGEIKLKLARHLYFINSSFDTQICIGSYYFTIGLASQSNVFILSFLDAYNMLSATLLWAYPFCFNKPRIISRSYSNDL